MYGDGSMRHAMPPKKTTGTKEYAESSQKRESFHYALRFLLSAEDLALHDILLTNLLLNLSRN